MLTIFIAFSQERLIYIVPYLVSGQLGLFPFLQIGKLRLTIAKELS